MPEKRMVRNSRKESRSGKSASSQAGEYVKDQMEKMQRGTRGPKSKKQAIAIGLSEARRAGVKVPPKPKTKRTSEKRELH